MLNFKTSRLMGNEPDVLTITRAQGKFHLRGLEQADTPEHLAHLKRLSPADRHLRFQGGMSNQALEAYCNNINWSDRLAFGIFENQTLRGMGEVCPLQNDTEAELALSLESDYQNHGFGRLLLLSLILGARRLGRKTLRMVYLSENGGMQGLVRAAGIKSHYVAGTTECVFTVPDQPVL